SFAAGAPEGERRIDLVLDFDQGIQDHWSAGVEINLVSVDTGILARLRAIAINLEFPDTRRAGRDRPGVAALNPSRGRHAEISRHGKPLQDSDAGQLIRGFDNHLFSCPSPLLRRRLRSSRFIRTGTQALDELRDRADGA